MSRRPRSGCRGECLRCQEPHYLRCRELCQRCLDIERAQGTYEVNYPRDPHRKIRAFAENFTFMVETGENWEGIARRLGIDVRSLRTSVLRAVRAGVLDEKFKDRELVESFGHLPRGALVLVK